MESPDELTVLVLATRFFALCMMMTWIFSWLAPELIRTSPAGSLFDIMFRKIAKNKRVFQILTVVFAAAHLGCVCMNTGFLINGWYSESLAQIWKIPRGQTINYNVTVGFPCVAFALLVFRYMVPSVGSRYPLISFIVPLLVFAINYLENVFSLVANWETDAEHFISMAYYFICSYVLIQSVMLFRLVRKKPTVKRSPADSIEDESSSEKDESHQQEKKKKKKKVNTSEAEKTD